MNKDQLIEKVKEGLSIYANAIDTFAVKDGIIPNGWQITEFTDCLDGFYQAEEKLVDLAESYANSRVKEVLERLKKTNMDEIELTERSNGIAFTDKEGNTKYGLVAEYWWGVLKGYDNVNERISKELANLTKEV